MSDFVARLAVKGMMTCAGCRDAENKQPHTCGIDFALHEQERTSVGAAALAFCVATIVLIVHVLRRGRRKGKLHTNERFMRAYGALYMRYDDRYPYWEALILVRKLLLEIIAATLSNSPWVQLAICAVVFGVSLWLQLRQQMMYKPQLCALPWGFVHESTVE